MTRNRALALVFGALVAVFVLGSIITIKDTRDQLIGDIDENLSSEVDLITQFYNSFDRGALEEIIVGDNRVAITLVSALGDIELQIPAGPAGDPIPAPDLPVSRIIDRVGEIFDVSGTDDGPDYRVRSSELSDGSFIALAAPLDQVNDTLGSLARTLLVTLFAMTAVLGLIFWLLLRASLRPYDELVDTAEAIAGGDMARRAIQTTRDPDITRLTNSLNTMLDRIQTSLEERQAGENRVKQFAADASHELRTPISTIAGYSELYLSGAATDPASVDKQMQRINSEAQRVGRLVNDLLTLARLDQGHGVTLEPLDVCALLNDVVSDARVIDPSHDVSLTGAGCNAIDMTALGDRDALHQVFVNLLSNARIHAPGAQVEIELTRDADDIVITFSDHGPGMTDEVADHVFDRFFRAEKSRTSSVRSSGLGLSIVTSIIEAHDGTASVDSEVGTGSTFTITLPLSDRAVRAPGTSLSNR